MKLRSLLSVPSKRGYLLFLTLFLLATSIGLTSVDRKHGFGPHDKVFYANSDAVSFTRPGLVVKIQSAAIASDGTITAKVLFTDPLGVPLDKSGINSPGAVSAGSPGVIAAVFQPSNNEFTAYTTRTQTSPITNVSAVQANVDTGGAWAAPATDGSYTYTFKTKAPSGFDPTALHAIGVYGSRDLTAFNLGIQMADDVYYFTPSTGTAGADPIDEIKTASCQACHGPNMAFHGTTGRSSLRMCNLCHTQQSTDPDTGNTVDLKVMVHKIHMGSSLPSVIAGTPYQIIGYQQSVNDFSTVVFPAPAMRCVSCHDQSSGASNAKAYLTKPNRNACGACHDNVDFAAGTNHVGGAQTSDANCALCHQATGTDFDASITGAHVNPPESSLLGGIQWTITGITGTAGSKPTLTFTIADKNGNPLAPTDFNRLYATIAGPTTDYTAFASTGGYLQENLATATGSNGSYTYTFNNSIPANATGTFAVGLEGRRLETVLAGTAKSQSIEYGAVNPVMYFSVDGSAVSPRRAPTDIANCQTCHYRLSLHGENRIGNVQYCVFCHNPVDNDAAFRPASVTGPLQTIDLKFLAHRIHGGSELATNFGTDYVVYGFGGSLNDFSKVRYPSALGDCYKCHVNGSENPSDLSTTYSAVATPKYPINPMPAITTACYGCHDSTVMLSHAQTMTSSLGEACAACHNSTAAFAPTAVHAATSTVDPGQAAK